MKRDIDTMQLNISGVENQLIDAIEEQGYVIVDRYLTPQLLAMAREEYAVCMRNEPLHAQGEKFVPADLEGAPWRKQAIGSRSGSGEPYSQVLQTTYFRPDDERFPALCAIFSSMISLRNALTGMRVDYGNSIATDAFWNACRIHHYPQGGGHMAAHRDTLFPHLLRNFKIPFIQMMVTLTSRGTDFHTGGCYVIDRNGQKVFFETADNAGSLVLFDGSTIHGVDDIDPSELLDFSSPKGRMALFVNLYKNHQIDQAGNLHTQKN